MDLEGFEQYRSSVNNLKGSSTRSSTSVAGSYALEVQPISIWNTPYRTINESWQKSNSRWTWFFKNIELDILNNVYLGTPGVLLNVN